MIIAVLVVWGLCLGSFVNALVWRLHEQAKKQKKETTLSITKGRSMCPHCRHNLSWRDLIPVFSWLRLRGKCRYCKKPISGQYPLVELMTATLFVGSYLFWPLDLQAVGDWTHFGLWLVILTGFMALLVYDLKWMLLPNRIMYPLFVVGALLALICILLAESLGCDAVVRLRHRACRAHVL